MSVPSDATSVEQSSLHVPAASATPSVHDEIAQGLKEHPAKKGLRFNLFVTAVEIGGSIGLFHLARSMGASDVGSYLAGSIAPILGALMIWAKARKFSGASAAIFTFTIRFRGHRPGRQHHPQGAALQGLRGNGPRRPGLLGIVRRRAQTGGLLPGSAVWDGRHP